VALALAAAFAVSQTCQKSQIRISKDQAIARAEQRVSFEATDKQVRLLRQGVQSRPFWMVSLSIPGNQAGTFKELAVVQINANTGQVAKVEVQRNAP
jgi:hypothetical protein